MMQSAPISRAAATVFSRCCATSVSTVGHAGDVDDRDLRAGLDDPLQQALHHDLRAGAVERADQRQREDAVPQLHDRASTARASPAAAGRSPPRAPSGRPRSCRGRAGRAAAWPPRSPRPARPASLPSSWRSRSNSGCFSEKTKVAVSTELNPWRARSREMSLSSSRTPLHSAWSGSVTFPVRLASPRALRNRSAVARSSRSLPARWPSISCCRLSQSVTRTAWWCWRISGKRVLTVMAQSPVRAELRGPLRNAGPRLLWRTTHQRRRASTTPRRSVTHTT